ADIDRDAFGDLAAPAAIDVELDIAVRRAALDRRAPGAEIEPAGRCQVDTALEGDISTRQRYAAESVIGSDGNVARDGDRRIAPVILGDRRCGYASRAGNDGSSQQAADGRKHGQFPLDWGEKLLLRPTCVSRLSLVIGAIPAIRRQSAIRCCTAQDKN